MAAPKTRRVEVEEQVVELAGMEDVVEEKEDKVC